MSYLGGIRGGRAAEQQCYQQMAKLYDTFFAPLQRRGLMFARNPDLDLPLVEYIFRFILPTIRCPRLHMWLRVRAPILISPIVQARHGAAYVGVLERELRELRMDGMFGANWPQLYAMLTQQQLEFAQGAM